MTNVEFCGNQYINKVTLKEIPTGTYFKGNISKYFDKHFYFIKGNDCAVSLHDGTTWNCLDLCFFDYCKIDNVKINFN
jgi:hypothetical protein